MNNLSVVIIAFNEESNIGGCIDSVSSLADDIVVVDSNSTDRTAKIAGDKGARVLFRPFTGYIEQKNFAMSEARFDFVLNLDADERISEQLKNSLLEEKKCGFPFDAYGMNRLNFYCGRAIKTAGWYPDTKIRLWNRQKGKWVGELVHEKMELKAGSSLKHLFGDILHYTYPTHEALLKQVDNFATLAAHQLSKRNSLYLYSKLVFSPAAKFLRNYIFKLGFTDGAVGFTICYQQAREVFLKYKRALALKNRSR